MGRKTSLSIAERAKIEAYKEEGYSSRAIAAKIGRGKTVINNFLRNMDNYGKNMKGRTYRATSQRERCLIIRKASNSASSVSKIRSETGVNASLSTVRRIIKSCSHLKRKKLQKKPPLNKQRKEKRLEFGRAKMTWSSEWRTVVFSDEKKFNLDGPDGYNYYFHDLRKEPRFLTKHHSREGGVMVWGAVSYYGTSEIVFESAKMTAESYKRILESAFPHFKELFGPIPWTFQHDNAPIHTARAIKSWIQSQNVELMQWPPYSPDLNIVENVWAWMTRKVYENGRQYDDKNSLIKAINEVWSEISLDYLKSLYDSLPNRIFEVISNKGGCTKY